MAQLQLAPGRMWEAHVPCAGLDFPQPVCVAGVLRAVVPHIPSSLLAFVCLKDTLFSAVCLGG